MSPVTESSKTNFQAWKVIENNIGHGKWLWSYWIFSTVSTVCTVRWIVDDHRQLATMVSNSSALLLTIRNYRNCRWFNASRLWGLNNFWSWKTSVELQRILKFCKTVNHIILVVEGTVRTFILQALKNSKPLLLQILSPNFKKSPNILKSKFWKSVRQFLHIGT